MCLSVRTARRPHDLDRPFYKVDALSSRVAHREAARKHLEYGVVAGQPLQNSFFSLVRALAEDADPFELLRASLAEIDRREGYEVKLVAALENCKRQIISSE